MRFSRRGFIGRSSAAMAALYSALQRGAWAGTPQVGGEKARGAVYHDRDGDGRRGSDDPGIGGIAVSNGRDVTLTDDDGRWELPVLPGATDFHVIPSRNWTVPTLPDNRRLFHYLHQPEGSPPSRFAGLPATGPLPESIEFALREEEQPDKFRVLLCGDPQPRDLREVGYLARSVPRALAREQAAFAVALGDVAFDDLAVYDALTGALGTAGLPWHYVIGNHDLNFDAPDRFLARQTYRRHFGPTAYAFNHGPAHFVVLDNIDWLGADPDNPRATGNYRGHIDERQLEFLANDLEHVPREALVVLLVHIPIYNAVGRGDRSFTLNRRELFRIIEDRPHTLSFSAHTHTIQHLFLGEEEGWQGAAPHHHVINGTLCGSWFGGAPGGDNIPHAIMSDGTPRGYMPLDIDGNRYKLPCFQGFNRVTEDQMHVVLPEAILAGETGDTEFHVNVYNASDRAEVRCRVADGEWRTLQQVHRSDPKVEALARRDRDLSPPWRRLTNPSPCRHLWAGNLPADLPAGTHRLEIEADDSFGHVHRAVHPVRVMG